MKRFVRVIITSLICSLCAIALHAQTITPGTPAFESVVTVLEANAADSKLVSSGLVVGSNGLILTTLGPFRGAAVDKLETARRPAPSPNVEKQKSIGPNSGKSTK